MSTISALPEHITNWLREQEIFSDIKFLTEFPAINKSVPLKSPIVAVGLSDVKLSDHFVANDDGVLVREEYCREAALRLRFGIHVPFQEGGSRCHEIFTRILDALSFASDLNIRQSGCHELNAHRDTDAFVLEAYADVLADFCPAESTGLPLASFLPKELLCGSHISNEDIHLSAAERSWINAPYAHGSYFGDGGASRTISLGFQPNAVWAFAKDYPAVHPVFGSTSTPVYSAFATRSGNAIGISLTSTGFTLYQGTARALGTSYPALNSAGIQYAYFIVK